MIVYRSGGAAVVVPLPRLTLRWKRRHAGEKEEERIRRGHGKEEKSREGVREKTDRTKERKWR